MLCMLWKESAKLFTGIEFNTGQKESSTVRKVTITLQGKVNRCKNIEISQKKDFKDLYVRKKLVTFLIRFNDI